MNDNTLSFFITIFLCLLCFLAGMSATYTRNVDTKAVKQTYENIIQCETAGLIAMVDGTFDGEKVICKFNK